MYKEIKGEDENLIIANTNVTKSLNRKQMLLLKEKNT